MIISLKYSAVLYALVYAGISPNQILLNFAPSENAKYQVEVKIQKHAPYCGGAYPNSEQKNGFISPVGNKKFALFKADSINSKHHTKSKPLHVFTTDTNGIYSASLEIGYYYVVDYIKTRGFKYFYDRVKVESDNFVQSGSRACYETWYETPELNFLVVDSNKQTFTATLSEACFTGLNKCALWIGPIPPSSNQ